MVVLSERGPLAGVDDVATRREDAAQVARVGCECLAKRRGRAERAFASGDNADMRADPKPMVHRVGVAVRGAA